MREFHALKKCERKGLINGVWKKAVLTVQLENQTTAEWETHKHLYPRGQ
jgi:hypothetical protein